MPLTVKLGDLMSDNVVVEEYNALVRSITNIEGSTILLIVYWVGLFILFLKTGMREQVFKDLVINGTIVGTLLKVYERSENGN